MPAGYEHMRDKFYEEFLRDGLSHEEAMKKAKEKAAKIWNSEHPNEPVHGGMHE